MIGVRGSCVGLLLHYSLLAARPRIVIEEEVLHGSRSQLRCVNPGRSGWAVAHSTLLARLLRLLRLMSVDDLILARWLFVLEMLIALHLLQHTCLEP